jgi:hypothetical protein
MAIMKPSVRFAAHPIITGILYPIVIMIPDYLKSDGLINDPLSPSFTIVLLLNLFLWRFFLIDIGTWMVFKLELYPFNGF